MQIFIRIALFSFSCVQVCQLVAAPAISPKSKAVYDEGYSAAVAGDRVKAREKFEEALKLDPANFVAHFDIGGLAENAKDTKEAIERYEKTAEIAPDFAEAQVQLGTLYLQVERNCDKANERFKIALETRKPYVDSRFKPEGTRGQALRNLSVCNASKGNLGFAESIARSLLRDPNADRKHDSAMNTLLSRTAPGIRKATAQQYQKELAEIGALLHIKKKPAEAARAYLEFEKQHEKESLTPLDSWTLYEGLGLAYAMSNQIEKTAGPFEKSLKAASALPLATQQSSRFNLACAHASNGNGEQAIALLEEVLWADSVTEYDPERTKKAGYLPQISTDESLASIQKSPKLQALLQKYRR